MALVAQASGVPGVGVGYQLIKEIVGIEDQQAVMLSRIQRDVKLLREGPFSAANSISKRLTGMATTMRDYETHLREARNLLFLALGQS